MSDEIVEHGQVVRASDGSVDVRVAATSACESCSHCSRVDKDGMLISDVSNDVGASTGDTVEVLIPSGTDLRAGMYAYVVPVVALFVGYGLGNALGTVAGFNGDLTGALGAFIFAVLSVVIMRGVAQRVLGSDRFRPRVRAIMAAAHQPGATSSGRADS